MCENSRMARNHQGALKQNIWVENWLKDQKHGKLYKKYKLIRRDANHGGEQK